MATIELKPGAQAPAPVVPTSAPESQAPAASNALAVTGGGGGGIQGEVDGSDFQIPWLSLVQKSGTLADTFDPGSFVFNKTIQIGTKESAEVRVVAHAATKYYEETLPFDSPEIPRRWDRRQDIPQGVEYHDAADLSLFVELDQPVSGLSVEHGGKHWAASKFTVRKSSYGVMRTLVTDQLGFLKDGLLTGTYRMGRDLITRERNSWYAPKLRADGRTPAELVEKIQNLRI